MRKIIRTFLSVGASFLLLLPIFGYLFFGSMVVSAIGIWATDSSVFGGYLSVAWKIYVALGILTFFILVTFNYQQCCFGLKGFVGHLKHRAKEILVGVVIAPLIWPFIWHGMDQGYREWGSSWGQIVYDAFHHWFVDAWKGARYESINVQTGEVLEGRIRP